MTSDVVDKNSKLPGNNRRFLESAVLAAVTAASLWIWLTWGWQIGLPLPVGPFLSHFPTGSLLALLAATALVFACLVAGAAALRIASSNANPGAETLLVAFLLGAVLLGTVAAGLGQFWLPRFWVILPVSLIAFWFGRDLIIASIRTLPFSRAPEAILWRLLVVLVIVGGMGPVVESDGLRYHVAAAEVWRLEGRVVLLPLSANSNLPLLGSAVAALAPLELVGRVFQLLQATFFAVGTLCVGYAAAQVCRLLRSESSAHTVFWPAVFLAASLPVAGILGSWPFADAGAAALVAGGLITTLRSDASSPWSWIIVPMVLLAGSFVAKISVLPVAGLVGVVLLYRLGSPQRAAAGAGLALVLALLIFAPWGVKNTMYHGNPVYPLGYSIFGGPEWSEANQQFYAERLGTKGNELTLSGFASLPWSISTDWQRFEGHNPGPAIWVLLGGLALFGILVAKRCRLLALALMFFFFAAVGSWFITYQSIRFLIPHLWVFTALAIPSWWIVTDATTSRWSVARGCFLALSIFGAAWIVVYSWGKVPLYQVALGIYNQNVYTTLRFNGFPAIRWLNEVGVEGERVLFVGEHRRAYARFPALVSDWFDTPMILALLRQHPDASPEEILRAEKVGWVLYNRAELSLYERDAFQPRFSPLEWARFEAFRAWLFQQEIAFREGDGLFVFRVGQEPSR